MRETTPRTVSMRNPLAGALAGTAVGAVLLATVTACAGLSGGSQGAATSFPATATADGSAASSRAATSSTGTPTTDIQTAAAQPPLDPATAVLKDRVATILNTVAAADPKPAEEHLRAALTGAGIPAPALEVSPSRTPTGLDVDSMEVAVLQGKDCIVAQIRDGGVEITVLPVLASGRCFV